MQIHPYLFFDGTCEDAIEFYRGALRAEVVMMMRYKESPDPVPPEMVQPGWEDKIMHATLKIGDAILMASDGGCSDGVKHGGYSLSISVPDAATADRVFAALSQGGTIQMPLDQTFWSPRFGMLVDRFGVGWMVNVVGPHS